MTIETDAEYGVRINEMLRGDYPQPHCPVCGRFARRAPGGSWEFACLWYEPATQLGPFRLSGSWMHA